MLDRPELWLYSRDQQRPFYPYGPYQRAWELPTDHGFFVPRPPFRMLIPAAVIDGQNALRHKPAVSYVSIDLERLVAVAASCPCGWELRFAPVNSTSLELAERAVAEHPRGKS